MLLQTSNCSCNLQPNVTHFSFDHYTVSICNLPIVPSWIIAVVFGPYFGVKFYRLGQQVTGSLAYSITYIMYAIMITSGLVVHCLYLVECGQQHSSQLYVDFGRIDVGLTSCIAISFAFDGLVDLKIIPERSRVTMIIMLFFYGAIFYVYFYLMEWAEYVNLYFNSIIFGCSLYMLTQLFTNYWLVDCSNFSFLMGAGLVGGSGLLLIRTEYCWLCKILGPWSVEGLWYYVSDVSMLLLGIYIWKSRSESTSSGQ